MERRFDYSTQKGRCGGRPGGTQPMERASTSKAFGKGTTSCKWDSVRAAPSVGRTLTSAQLISLVGHILELDGKTWRLAQLGDSPRGQRRRGGENRDRPGAQQ